jgi:hypothetical protein
MPSKNERTQAGQGAAKGAGAGAAAGIPFGPPGMALGAGIGGVGGGIAGYSTGRQQDKKNARAADDARAEAGALQRGQAAANQYAGITDPNIQRIVAQYQAQSGRAADPLALENSISQYKFNQQQDALANQVNAFFQDPSRAAAYQQYLQTQQNQQLGALGVQTQAQQRADAFKTAATGQEGSSMQAERGADTAQHYQMGASDVAANTAQSAQDWQNQQNQLRAQQLQQVYGVQPGAEQGVLSGLGQQSYLSGETQATQANFPQINQAAGAGGMAAIASGINGLTGGLRGGISYNPYGPQAQSYGPTTSRG